MRKMFDWIKDTKEARIALAICAGLLLYRLVSGILRAVFYDRYREEWHYGWMLFAVAVPFAMYWLVQKWRDRRRRIRALAAIDPETRAKLDFLHNLLKLKQAQTIRESQVAARQK